MTTTPWNGNGSLACLVRFQLLSPIKFKELPMLPQSQTQRSGVICPFPEKPALFGNKLAEAQKQNHEYLQKNVNSICLVI